MKNLNRIIWGVSLVIIGIVYGLNSLEIIDINIFFDGWWTLFIIIPCLIGLINGKDTFGNLVGILIGTSLLFVAQDLITIDKLSRLIIPSILIGIGLTLLFKNRVNDTIARNIKKLSEKSSPLEYSAIFSNQVLILEDEINHIELNAVFGGIKCNLRNAIIKEDIVINATSVFGGIDIFVPDDVTVKVKETTIFGGVDNKKILTNNPKKEKVVYVNVTCVFGGVDIK